MHILGFSFHSSSGECNISASPAEDDPIELLGKQLRLGRGDDVFEKIFSNSLHALQVVQFYYWKKHELAARREQSVVSSGTVCCPVTHHSKGTELPLPCNHALAQTIFGSYNTEEIVQWNDFALAVAMWEKYSEELKKQLLTFLPYWLSNETIYVVDTSELQRAEPI